MSDNATSMTWELSGCLKSREWKARHQIQGRIQDFKLGGVKQMSLGDGSVPQWDSVMPDAEREDSSFCKYPVHPKIRKGSP